MLRIKINTVQETLASMKFAVAPYAEEGSINDYEHIKELATAYNKLVDEISAQCECTFEKFVF